MPQAPCHQLAPQIFDKPIFQRHCFKLRFAYLPVFLKNVAYDRKVRFMSLFKLAFVFVDLSGLLVTFFIALIEASQTVFYCTRYKVDNKIV